MLLALLFLSTGLKHPSTSMTPPVAKISPPEEEDKVTVTINGTKYDGKKRFSKWEECGLLFCVD